MIPPLPRIPNLSPTRYLYGIWLGLKGLIVAGKLPELPRDPNIAPTPLLNAIFQEVKNGGGGLPSQTGHAGEFLGTDGTTASWLPLPGGGDMLAATYDPAGVVAQLAGASGEAINAGAFLTALGATAVGSGVFLAANTAAGLAALGATTIGTNLVQLANPGAISFFRANADNSVSMLDAPTFRTAIGAGTGSGDLLAANNLSDLLSAPTALTNLGGTTVGQNFFTLPNPSAISIPSIAADNTVSAISPAAFATLIGAALTSGTLAQFAATTSAQLRTLLSDELGTGAALFDGATPTSFTLTNASGLPAVGVVGTAAILGANTFTGQQIISLNGAASTPPVTLTGTIFTGGSATTTKPQLLVEPAGTTTTGWQTTGTLIGANGPAAYAGSLIDLQVAGVSKLRVKPDGALQMAGGSVVEIWNTTDTGAGTGSRCVHFSSGLCFAAGNGNQTFYLAGDGTRVSIGPKLNFNTATFAWGAGVAAIVLDASDVLSLRRTTNAQTLRVYGTADADGTFTNYTRFAVNTTSTTVALACETAGTGTDDIDLSLTPAGAGLVKFGAFTADLGVVLAGSINIKTADGTTRKVAIVA